MMFAGWVNRQRLDVIDYLQEGNRVLKERLGGRRIRFTDAERRRLARKAYALGLGVEWTGNTVLPNTLLRWYRDTRGSAARWPIWDIRLAEAPSPTSYWNIASGQLLSVTDIHEGRRSSKLTGNA
jgi:hypothetical protein